MQAAVTGYLYGWFIRKVEKFVDPKILSKPPGGPGDEETQQPNALLTSMPNGHRIQEEMKNCEFTTKDIQNMAEEENLQEHRIR